jgi:molybdopterin converting factor small subunit
MAVTVSIPTILRTYTGGEKSVEAKGDTLSEVISDLDARHGGLKGRLLKDGSLHRFINIYVNDEDVRFAGGLEAPVADGDSVTILPAVAGGSTALAAGPAGFLPAVAGGSTALAAGPTGFLPAVARGSTALAAGPAGFLPGVVGGA